MARPHPQNGSATMPMVVCRTLRILWRGNGGSVAICCRLWYNKTIQNVKTICNIPHKINYLYSE